MATVNPRQLVLDAMYAEVRSLVDVVETVACPDAIERCESPIETLFLYALWSVSITRGWTLYSRPNSGETWCLMHHDDAVCGPTTLRVTPQWKRGKWRHDFHVEIEGAAALAGNELVMGRAAVLVECDGHDYHERTKEQAARDRRRDRDCVAAKLTVLRYTGSELHGDPIGCASQCVEILERMLHAD